MPTITAIADFKGTFIQGTTGTLFLKITDFDGNPTDPEEITITIRFWDGTLITSTTPEKATEGFYVYDWETEDDQTVGEYEITWEFERDGETYTELQSVIVAENADDTNMYSGKAIAVRESLERYITCAQNIPVYFEQSKPTHNRRTYRFTFPRWNQVTGVKIYRNNNLMDSGLEVNFFNGEVVFDTTQTQYDMIHADYNFRWFTDSELDEYLNNAVADFNSYPPHTGYTLAGSAELPDRYLPSIIRKAAVDAIRHLMMCLQFQQPQQVFGGAEGAAKAFANFETLKKNYEGDWDKVVDAKKYGPYPRTMIISTPEYTLPGGRSRWFRYLFSSGQ